MPSAIQTAIWFHQAQWLMAQCTARYGETFTVRILHEDPWVVLSNPAHVKQAFTGDPRVFHAGEGNRILLPVVGEHSVLLLDERAHPEQRKLLLPSFNGQRMQRYGALMTEIAAAEIERWPRGEPYRLRPRMQALTLEIIVRTVFGLDRGQRLERLSVELRRVLDMLTNPRDELVTLLVAGHETTATALPGRSSGSSTRPTTRSADRRGLGRRNRVPRRGHRRGSAPSAGHLDRHPQTDRASGDRRSSPACRGGCRAVRVPRPPPT